MYEVGGLDLNSSLPKTCAVISSCFPAGFMWVLTSVYVHWSKRSGSPFCGLVQHWLIPALKLALQSLQRSGPMVVWVSAGSHGSEVYCQFLGGFQKEQ